jgi:hypothetical protein
MSESSSADSKLQWTQIDAMRPTQCTVGFLEVEFKLLELRERATRSDDLPKYLKGHPIPAVLGPDGHMYLTDHHHMGLALVTLANEWDKSDKPAAKNPFRSCCFRIVKDYSDRHELSMRQFFSKLEQRNLCHPIDGQGNRVDKLPKSLSELVDDPYRSLAGLARKAGAYDKVDIPFLEFMWADYLRDKVDPGQICRDHLVEAIHGAVVVANDQLAARLPGYHGGKSSTELPTLLQISERLSKRYGADDAAPGLLVVGKHRNAV